MMDKIRELILPLAFGLILAGCCLDYGDPVAAYVGERIGWSVSGPCECVVVAESGNRTPAVAAVYNSKAVYEASKKCKLYRWLDPNVDGPDLPEVQWALDAAKGRSEPVAVIRRGKSVKVYVLPATPDAMLSLLKKNGA